MNAGPTNASLRRVGLAWYAEEVPAYCSRVFYPEQGKITLNVFSQDCVKAITGKPGSEKLTQSDLSKIADYLKANGFPLTLENRNPLQVITYAAEQIGILGKPISALQNASTVFDLRTANEDAAEAIHDAADTVGDASKFLAKLFDPANLLAIVLLVVGGGLLIFGGMRLLTQ